MRFKKSIVAFLVSLSMLLQTMPVMAATSDATKIQAVFFLHNVDGSGYITDGCTVRGGIKLTNYTDTNTPEIYGFSAEYGLMPSTALDVKADSDYGTASVYEDASSGSKVAYGGAKAVREVGSNAISRSGDLELLTFTMTYHESDETSLTKWPMSFFINGSAESATSGARLILYDAKGAMIAATGSFDKDNLKTSKETDPDNCYFIQPSKHEYEYNEDFDFSDGGFEIAYKDGTKDFIALDNEEIKKMGFTTTVAGTRILEVSYTTADGVTIKGKITVKVNEKPGNAIAEVTLTPPTKLEYNVGDTVDLTGGLVTVVLESGEIEEYTLDNYLKASDLTVKVAGTKTFYIYHNGIERSFTVTAIDPNEEEEKQPVSGVFTPPTKLTYVIGEVLDPTGGSWTITYDNGEVEVFELGDVITFGPLTTAGRVPVTVEFLGFEDTFYVTVSMSSDSGLKNVTFVPPTQLEYNVGDILNPNGSYFEMTYEITDANGKVTEKKVKKTLSEILTELPLFTEAGTRELTVEYEGITQKFTVTVSDGTEKKTLVSLEVTKKPDKMSYKVGDTFDPTGGVITATYSDGSTEEIAMSKFFTDNNLDPKLNTEGTVVFTFKKNGVTVDFSIVVGKASGSTSSGSTGGNTSSGGNTSGSGSSSSDDNGSDNENVIDVFKEDLSNITISNLTTNDLESVYKLLAVFNGMSDEEKAELSDGEKAKVLALAQWYVDNSKSVSNSSSESGSASSEGIAAAEAAASSASEALSSSPATGVSSTSSVVAIVCVVAIIACVGVIVYKRKNKKNDNND